MKLTTYTPVFILLLLAACQKEIMIDIPEPRTQPLFIEGILFLDETPKIYISQSNPFFSAEVSPQEIFARGAEVTISDESNRFILQPDSVFNKFRCRWEPFYGGAFLPEQGKRYTLEISYQGKSYSATTTLNQRKVAIENISYTPEFFDVYGGHDGVIIKIQDPVGKGENYRFRMDRLLDNSVLHAHALDGFINECTEEGELFPVIDVGREVFRDQNVDGQMLEMYIEVSYEYSEGDETWVFIQTLSDNVAEFYQNLDDQLVAIGNPFVEPIFIETKIAGAVGVFGSGVLSDSLLFIYPQDNP